MQLRFSNSSSTTRVIFLHHSVGADLMQRGNVRELLRRQAPSVELWDHGYNPRSSRRIVRDVARALQGRPPVMPDRYYGLRDGSGRLVHGSFAVPFDNTDPDGMAAVFAQPVTSPPSNTLSWLLQFDVIAFKPCFTMLPLRSDAQLDQNREHYRAIRRVMDRHADKLFIPITPPPLRANLTSAADAARARQFARWMMSDDFHGGRSNIAPFDLFDAFTVAAGQPDANTLRPEFCPAEVGDTHPNEAADHAVAPLWVSFLAQAIGQASNLRKAAVAH